MTTPKSEVEVNPGAEQRALIAPLVVEVIPARVRRPLRYSPLADVLSTSALAGWLVATLLAVLDGVLVVGALTVAGWLWLALGIALAVAAMATIKPHAGGAQ